MSNDTWIGGAAAAPMGVIVLIVLLLFILPRRLRQSRCTSVTSQGDLYDKAQLHSDSVEPKELPDSERFPPAELPANEPAAAEMTDLRS